MIKQEKPPLLSDEEIRGVVGDFILSEGYSKLLQYLRDCNQAQRDSDIKWMKEHCYFRAKRNLPKCKPVSLYPKNAYKEAQLDMLKEVDGVSFKAVREFE